MRGLIFKTAKEAFRRGFRKYKRGARETERVPYDLVKADIKRKIRGTKFTSAAEIKAKPGLRRRIFTRIERSKRNRTPGGRPRFFGKAYASDKRGKSLQINPLSKKDRQKIQDDISESVKKFLKRKKDEPMSFKKGGMKKKLGGLNTIKMVKSKLEKASAAHAGQAKALGKILPKKMMGGLLTAGIKGAAKKLFKSGSRKTQQIVKESGVSRSVAKSDVKSSIRDQIKSDYNFVNKKFQADKNNRAIKMKRRIIISDLNKLK